jgi:ABC-2 type transport system permease protein
MRWLANVHRLGVKELWSLLREPTMLGLIAYTFSVAIYVAAKAQPDTLSQAAIAIVDEDRSALSTRLVAAFYPPQFSPPRLITPAETDPALDAGRHTFVLDIPPNFQRDVLAGKSPELQLNVDATRMSQAFSGSGYIQQIALSEVSAFLADHRGADDPVADLVTRTRFNPALDHSWFGSVMELINNVTMLAIILTGAALIREREHGTIEHLLVMPVTPLQIMLAKLWSMGLVVWLATALSLNIVVRGALQVPIEGSQALFLIGVALHLFAMTSMAIFMATLARNMPQFALLVLLILLPMSLLSGGTTPRESMPVPVQTLMLVAPTTHFVELSQAILYRGAGLDVVWRPFLALICIGAVLFAVSLRRFRRTIAQMA